VAIEIGHPQFSIVPAQAFQEMVALGEDGEGSRGQNSSPLNGSQSI
jgi:hypothetical protein